MEGLQILARAQGKQGGHDLMGFVSKPREMAQVQVHGQPNNIKLACYDDLFGVQKVITIGLTKKE